MVREELGFTLSPSRALIGGVSTKTENMIYTLKKVLNGKCQTMPTTGGRNNIPLFRRSGLPWWERVVETAG